MVSATSVVLALALAAGAHASISKPIAGYYPGSDVEDHNDVDISGRALSKFLAGENYDGTDLGTGAAGIKYNLATSMYADGTGGSSQKVKYTVKGVSAVDTPAMIVKQTATEVSSVWGFDNQVTGNRDTTGVASGDTRSNSYTCKEDDNADGTFNVPLGKMALKKGYIGANPSTGNALEVYMSDGWSTKECGQVPFRDAVSSTCPGTGATAIADACADQYKDASCPGGGVAKSSTTVKIKCTASAAWASPITYVAAGATTFSQRTLKGFSTAVQAKMIDGLTKPEPEAVAAKAYHTVASYGDMTISAALKALTDTTATAGSFSTCTTPNTANANIDAVGCTAGWTQGTAICKHKDTRAPMVNLAANTHAGCVAAGGKVTDFFLYKADGSGAADKKKLTIEVIQKMAVYTNAWLYTIHEFEDAIADCKKATIHDNDEGVHAWDEGVAFYTGSNAGEAGYYTAAGAKNGNMIYALANKRCKNFKTCGVGEFSGNSAVNIALFDQFALGKNACQVGNCPKGQGHLDKVIPLMSVPLIQGTLRYAYKVAVLQDSYKGFGEGYAFMMSVIHRVGACSAADAKIIYEALDIPDVDPGATGFKLGGTATAPGNGVAAFTAVKEAFERNYPCMGITCADVGSLHDDNKLAMEGAGACVDSSSSSAAGTDTTTEKDVLPTWAIIAIAGAGALVVLFFGMMCAYKSSKDMTIKMYNDLKKEGAVGKV